jgi:hypothetical protein
MNGFFVRGITLFRLLNTPYRNVILGIYASLVFKYVDVVIGTVQDSS